MSNIILKEAIKFSLRFGSGVVSGILFDYLVGSFFSHKLDLIFSLSSLLWTAYSAVDNDFETIPPSLGYSAGCASFSLYKYIQQERKKRSKLVANDLNSKKNSKETQVNCVSLTL